MKTTPVNFGYNIEKLFDKLSLTRNPNNLENYISSRMILFNHEVNKY